MERYSFAAREGVVRFPGPEDDGWRTSGRLFDSIEAAGEAAKQWLVVCFENGVPCEVRLVVNRTGG
jgi:hypothetical protein